MGFAWLFLSPLSLNPAVLPWSPLSLNPAWFPRSPQQVQQLIAVVAPPPAPAAVVAPPAPALPPPAAPLDEVQVEGIVRRILATDLDALVETIMARMIGGRAHVQPRSLQ